MAVYGMKVPTYRTRNNNPTEPDPGPRADHMALVGATDHPIGMDVQANKGY